jgi:hypothetical protein
MAAQGAPFAVPPFERAGAAASGSGDVTSLSRRKRGLMQSLFGRSRDG